MADITKCGNAEQCPLKETCYRYTAPDNEHYQSYLDFFLPNLKCLYYLQVRKRRNTFMIDKSDLYNIKNRYDNATSKTYESLSCEVMAKQEFSAHCWTDIPKLLGYIEKLEKLVNAADFAVVNNYCDGKLSNKDWCKFCFMLPYCETREMDNE